MNRRMDAGHVRINRFISMHIVGFIIQNKFSIDKFQLDEKGRFNTGCVDGLKK